jgi:hypothetical protein
MAVLGSRGRTKTSQASLVVVLRIFLGDLKAGNKTRERGNAVHESGALYYVTATQSNRKWAAFFLELPGFVCRTF